MHIAIIVVCVAVIVFVQIVIFGSTNKLINTFRDIFPYSASKSYAVFKQNGGWLSIITTATFENYKKEYARVEGYEESVKQCKSEIRKLQRALREQQELGGDGSEFERRLIDLKEILEGYNSQIERIRGQQLSYSGKGSRIDSIILEINSYLQKNANSSTDFNLIKDIVDRNNDMHEEEIQTQTPVPLYCGLAGTMIGIIVGIGYMAFFQSVIDSSSTFELLEGVALAMISSFVGLFMTSRLSWKAKDAKKINDQNKNNFLSWMQNELLPVMSDDAYTALNLVSQNLNDFNNSFKDNTSSLSDTLRIVRETSDGQTQLLKAVKQLNITALATANVNVYDKLKNCTDEIGQLAQLLNDSAYYVDTVRKLNERLDASEERFHMIEEMARFFKEERASFEKTSGYINTALADAESNMSNVADTFNAGISQTVAKMTEHAADSLGQFEGFLDKQQSLLQNKSKELENVINEVKQLSEVKKSVDELAKASKAQAKKMDELMETIKTVVSAKTGVAVEDVAKPKQSKLDKILLYSGGGIVLVTCLTILVYIAISFSNLTV